MTKLQHFEDLWEKCEQYHENSSDISSAIDELILKCNLYKSVNNLQDIPADDKAKMKFSAIGEILFTLTNIAFIDKINVFGALLTTLKNRG